MSLVDHIAAALADCLHGFKSTIVDGASYVTSYDMQPNAVAPSDSPPSGLDAFRIDSAVLAARDRGVYFDVGHGQGARACTRCERARESSHFVMSLIW